MVGEIFAGVSALKSAFDIAKGLKDIDDVTRRSSAIFELQEKLLAAQDAYSALREEVRELENRVTDFETWDAEKQRYELKSLASAGVPSFAYAIRSAEKGDEPFHCICAACYQTGRKSLLQFKGRSPMNGSDLLLACPTCKAEIRAAGWPPEFAK
jgi:hypothetical protein